MRRAGQAVRAAQGLVVVRVPEGTGPSPETVDRDRPDLGSVPAIGTELVDDSLTTVGRVVDVFGPVSRPYLAVSPERRDPPTMLGDRLYVPD